MALVESITIPLGTEMPDFDLNDPAGKSFKAWQALGRDRNSIIADPQFIDPDNLNFKLRSGSPALKIDFKPFDYFQAGVYGTGQWIELARKIPVKSLQIAP